MDSKEEFKNNGRKGSGGEVGGPRHVKGPGFYNCYQYPDA